MRWSYPLEVYDKVSKIDWIIIPVITILTLIGFLVFNE